MESIMAKLMARIVIPVPEPEQHFRGIEPGRAAGTPVHVVEEAGFDVSRATDVEDSALKPEDIYDRRVPRQARGHLTRLVSKDHSFIQTRPEAMSKRSASNGS
jgi:hypothetical protein